MIRNWFMVPDDFDENKQSDDIYRIARLLKPHAKHKDHFTILTTTDCNARCYYCYEMGRKRIHMTEKTARDAADYMTAQCGGKPLKLFWFGGEPLYNISAIEIITETLRNQGVSYRSTMTSNGYYLTPDIAKRAHDEWGLERVQITIDGTEKVYNRIKAYTDDCENPFNRLMDNIEKALALDIAITIRLNMDGDNSEDISDAIDLLCTRFKEKGDCRIYVALLKSYKANVHQFSSEDEMLEHYFRLQEKIRSYGMLRTIPIPREIRMNRCKADNDVCEIILPDGQLERCHHYTEGEHIGSIYSDERDDEMIASWKEYDKNYPECMECSLYPICMRLKKCESDHKGCSNADRIIWRESIKERMLDAFYKWKGGTEA